MAGNLRLAAAGRTLATFPETRVCLTSPEAARPAAPNMLWMSEGGSAGAGTALGAVVWLSGMEERPKWGRQRGRHATSHRDGLAERGTNECVGIKSLLL